MKNLLLIFVFLLIFNSSAPASDRRISAYAPTKHEALVRAHGVLPHNAIIKRIYYSGGGKRYYCFIVYSINKQVNK